MLFRNFLSNAFVLSLLVPRVLCPAEQTDGEKYRCHVDDEAHCYDEEGNEGYTVAKFDSHFRFPHQVRECEQVVLHDKKPDFVVNLASLAMTI